MEINVVTLHKVVETMPYEFPYEWLMSGMYIFVTEAGWVTKGSTLHWDSPASWRVSCHDNDVSRILTQIQNIVCSIVSLVITSPVNKA